MDSRPAQSTSAVYIDTLIDTVHQACISTVQPASCTRWRPPPPPPVLEINPSLYDSHVPTTCLQKAVLAVGSAAMAFYDPARDDMVAALGETTGVPALQWMKQRMESDPVGQEILRFQPRISSKTIDLDALCQLPEGTFGHAYTQFLDVCGVTPDTRSPVKYVDDADLAYVMQRYREVHDFLHALTEMPISVMGEIIVKWFEMVQTGLPMCALSSFVGPLQLTSGERWRLMRTYIPWALQCGINSQFFMNVYYERHFEESVDSLRQRIGLTPPPPLYPPP